MLKLKLQYFGHLMRKTDSLEKTLMLGKIEGRRRRRWQRMRWLDGITTRWPWVWASSRSWWWKWKPGMLQSMGLQRADRTEQLNWTYYISFNWLTKEKANKLGQEDSIRCSTEQIVFHFISLFNFNAILILTSCELTSCFSLPGTEGIPRI